MQFDRMIVLDFETTGLEPGYRPVEIAWIEFDEQLNPVEQVDALVNPRIPIEPGAQQTHGISQEMVADRPTLDGFLTDVHGDKFVNEHVLVVAHNAKYDVPMFTSYCRKVTALCTMRLSQALYPDSPDHRLQTLTSFLDVRIEPNHRAAADAQACFEALRAISTRHSFGIAELIDTSNRFSMDSIIPFGKHKGTRLRELPASYVGWCLENLDGDSWVREVLASNKY